MSLCVFLTELRYGFVSSSISLISLFHPIRDGEDGDALSHGVSALCLCCLRHQQHWPHPATEDHSSLCLRHLLHPIRYHKAQTPGWEIATVQWPQSSLQ